MLAPRFRYYHHMRSLLVSGFLFSLALLTGCARAHVTTEIHPGGAWTRTVALAGQEKKEGQMGGSIEDSFILPTGDGWKSRVSKQQDTDQTITFERTLAAGMSLKGDLSVKGDAGTATLVNEVSVTRLTPRRSEYRETLRWTGPPPGGVSPKPEDLVQLKALLPPALATDENARGMMEKMADLLMPMIFGPGDPLLAIGLLHPDLAAKRASQRIGALMMKALEEQFGGRMTPAQRRDVTLKMIDTALAQAKPKTPDASATTPSNKGGAGLTPLMFIVKSPGKVISSNGDLDELTGEVFWALFPPAASLKPVVLTAVVEMDQP
jgi:hypothetical protein